MTGPELTPSGARGHEVDRAEKLLETGDGARVLMDERDGIRGNFRNGDASPAADDAKGQGDRHPGPQRGVSRTERPTNSRASSSHSK